MAENKIIDLNNSNLRNVFTIDCKDIVLREFQLGDLDAIYNITKLPAVDKMACVVHQGSFNTIGETYKAICQWIEKNNYKIDGPVREIYHNGEWETNNPEEYVTELQFPLA